MEAVGIIELTSIGLGYVASDAMVKAADVRVVIARTICSGKYLVAVTGPVAEVQAAVDAGLARIPDGLIDHAVIPRIAPAVFKALGQGVELRISPAGGPGGSAAALPKALGVVETFSATSMFEAADAAVKAAAVTLFRVHLAMALGGKAYMLLAGGVADVRAGVESAAALVRAKGLLVSAVTIPGPSRELLREYI